MTEGSPNLQAALALAAQGLFVFPCQSSGPNKKSPCKGVYWRSASTNDPKKIQSLWRNFPEAAPAIDLAKSNFLVVDCDKSLADGVSWLATYAAQFSDPLAVPYVDTPSTGRHLYYKNTDPPHNNGRGRLPPKKDCGIDIRGAGGFVLAPGAAFTDTNAAYTLHGNIADAPAPPGWLVELLSSYEAPPAQNQEPPSDERLKAYGQAALQELLQELIDAPEGDRNIQANRIAFRAGQLVGGGCLDGPATQAALQDAAQAAWGLKLRDKALGPRGTIARAIASGRLKPKGPTDTYQDVEILLPGLANSFASPDAPNPSQLPSKELPPDLLRVPGLVGDIADWITKTAMYPQPGLSLGAALVIVGTAAGRTFAGPTTSGTHLYVIGIARSTAGKDHPLKQIERIFQMCGLDDDHLGPSEFISMPAVINFIKDHPLSVCCMDEIGSFLKRVNSKHASGFERGVSAILRSAWGSSFDAIRTPAWAQTESQKVLSPSLSIFGVSTVAEFYDSLTDADIANGLLNRFLMIETKLRPDEQTNRLDKFDVPEFILNRVRAIYRSHGNMPHTAENKMGFVTLKIEPEAEKLRSDMVKQLRIWGDKDSNLEPFLGRTAEIAIRLATIVTIGLGTDCIEYDTMEWAREFALWSSTSLAESAGLYMADSETQAIANAVRQAIKKKSNGHDRAKRTDVLQALKHKYKRRELEDVIKSLQDAGDIRIESDPKAKDDPKGGPTTYWFSLRPDPASGSA